MFDPGALIKPVEMTSDLCECAMRVCAHPHSQTPIIHTSSSNDNNKEEEDQEEQQKEQEEEEEGRRKKEEGRRKKEGAATSRRALKSRAIKQSCDT